MRGTKAKRMRRYFGEEREKRRYVHKRPALTNFERRRYQMAKKALKFGRMVK